MARVVVDVFDNSTDQLVESVEVAISLDDVRTRWPEPLGEFLLDADGLSFLRQHGFQLEVDSMRRAFLGVRRSFPDETIQEPDGTIWHPPPG